ncbi:MAG: tetratricopeptide repeat protein [Candidatus Omnitrophota bacterium]
MYKNISLKKIFELVIILVLLVVLVFIGKNKLAVFYYNRGNDCFGRRLYKDAISYFNKALKIEPEVALVHYSLANAYMEDKTEDKAREEYNRVIRLDSRFTPAYKALARVYLKQGLYQEAMDILSKAEVIDPDNPGIKEAISYSSSEYIAYLLNAGADAFLAGDKLRAYELLNKALRINPDYAFSRYMLGYFYYADNKYDESEGMLKEAIRLDGKSFWARKLLGDVYFEKRIFDKAIEEYRLALAINGNDAVLLNNIGLAYMNLEKYDEAIPFLKESLSINPGNINIRYSLASLYRDSGRSSEAILEYNNLVNMQPDYPNVHNDLGDIYKQQGRIEEAFGEYRKEIYFCQSKLLRDPSDPFLLTDISYAYNGIEEYNKAKECIDKALAVKPDYRQAYLTLAGIHKNLGNSLDALAALKKAGELSSQKYFFIEKAITDIKEFKGPIGRDLVSSSADTVYLKNGRQLKGVIKEESIDNIILEINSAGIIGSVTLPRDNIERVVSKRNIN